MNFFTTLGFTYVQRKMMFSCISFMEWKASVVKSSGRKLNIFRTGNSGKYISINFDDYLKSEGIRHKFTAPTTPEQNAHVAKKDNSWIQSQKILYSSMLLRNNQRVSNI